MQFKKRGLITAAAILAVGAVLGAWITAKIHSFPFSYAPVPVSAQATPPITFETGFGAVVEKVTPAVVTVHSTQTVRSESRREPFFNLPNTPFDDFFRQFEERVPRIRQGLGSGVITSADGYIITNAHVIDGADQVKVTLQDKREFTAKVVGKDEPSDVAVLKVEANNLPFVAFGDSDTVKVGDIVLAIGNPFGVGQTVTMGIVGAVGRNGLDIEQYEDFIQTDAAINPGNSGGALVNMRGEVIGINTAILTGGSRGNQGVGFAIPAKMVANVRDQIIRTGKVTRGWLGVSIQPVTADIAKQFNLPGSPRGALVGDVNPGSPADRAGLRRGDIITELNGTPVPDSAALRTRVAALAPGSTAQLKVFREGREQTISVTLGERPADAQISRRGGSSGEGLQLGVTVEPVNPQNRRQFGLSARASGLVITSVTPGSAAEEAGLRVGDVIQEVNRQPVDDVAQFQRMVRGATGPLLLYVYRDGNGFYVTANPR